MAEASGRASLRADERRHSPFVRQRRQKAMPARLRGKSQLSIAREGFLDRRSKRCFWLLLSPQTKVARAGARNSPLRRGRGSFAPLRGDTSSAPFGGTFPSRGRLEGAPLPPRTPQGEGLRVRHSHRGPLKGKANGGVSFNAATHQGGRLWGCGIQHREHPGGKLEGAAGVQRKFTVFLQNLKVELRKASML